MQISRIFLLTLLTLSSTLHAAEQSPAYGVASLGSSGGLTIPYAHVVNADDVVIATNNYHEPMLGPFKKRHDNYYLGFGLFPNIEVFGRFAEYQNYRARITNGWDANGPRDLSANIKWKLPLDKIQYLPDIAIGATDLHGGSTYFISKYIVASGESNGFRWSAGYAQTPNDSQTSILDGVFGGIEAQLWNSRASLLAETDGIQQHIGLRYYSQPIDWLAHGKFSGSLHRSLNAETASGENANKTSYHLNLQIPMHTNKASWDQRRRKLDELPALAASELPQQLEALHQALQHTGLESIRTGEHDHSTLVIEYQNYRYLHNEADALGIIAGLAAELAPGKFSSLHIRNRKAGLIIQSTLIDRESYRRFLRDRSTQAIRQGIQQHYSEIIPTKHIHWHPTQQTRNYARIELQPLLNYSLGTEYGAFDYALGIQARSKVPLWQGAELYSDLVHHISNSNSVEAGQYFSNMRHRNGLKTLVLQQSLWLTPSLFTSIGAGKFNYEGRGGEIQNIWFTPWSNDTVHLKASYRNYPLSFVGRETIKAGQLSYRKHFGQRTWLQVGYNRFTDATFGPSVRFTRWFDDIAVEFSGEKSDQHAFVAAWFSIPLTPREGIKAGPIALSGTSRFAINLRTRVSDDNDNRNLILPDATVPIRMHYRSEEELLNSGRMSADYFKQQLPRMREAFYRYGRKLTP